MTPLARHVGRGAAIAAALFGLFVVSYLVGGLAGVVGLALFVTPALLLLE